MQKNVNFKYDFGDIVYFIPSTHRCKGIVTGIQFSPAWEPMYNVTWESGESGNHWEFELTDEFEPDFEAEAE